MTTDERTRRALERARENDSNNQDATRRVTSSVISAGSEDTRSRTERALQSARQKDREPKRITPSRELSGTQSPAVSGTRTPSVASGANGVAGGRLQNAMTRFGDRGLIDTAASSDNWDSVGKAEAGLRLWESEAENIGVQLTEQENRITDLRTELDNMSAGGLRSQADVDRYNTLAAELAADGEEYNALVGEYNRLVDRVQGGTDKYRELLSGGLDRANSYSTEADTLERRNAELEREMQRYELGVPYFEGVDRGVSTGERLNQLRREYDENTERIAQLRRDADDARMQYYSSLRLADDWEQNSAPLEAGQAARIAGSGTPYSNGSSIYNYINNLGPIAGHTGYTSEGNRYESYSTMTPDEVGIYNYLYATQGAEAAGEFLSQMQETLNYRLGAQNYADMGGLGKALYWIPAGLSQFSGGVEQLFSREAVPTSPTLYTSSMIQQEAQERSPVLGTLYELGTTLSNMAPSILASSLGAWALGMPAAAAGALGSATLGASAGGNAYTQALNEGYKPDEAREYAILVGASEGALQYLLGGIENLGSAGARTIASKIGAMDNALGRIARSSGGRLIGSMISEGTEEGLQEMLEPAFRTLIFDEEYDANFGDVAYSFLLGALSAGVIEGPGAVRESIQRRRQPSAPDFSAMEGYLDENGVDNFQGARTLDELDSRYMELANSENAESLDWESIANQYRMARAYLRGLGQTEQETETQEHTVKAAVETDGIPDDGIVLPETEGEATTLPTSDKLERRQRATDAATELERSGILAGAADADIEAARRLSSLIGREIRFYNGADETGTSNAANGYFSGGTIYVNTRSENPVAQIVSHELTHSIETADSYSELSNYVLEKLRRDEGSLDALRQHKREVYARNGVNLDDAGIDQELVAEYVEKHLLTDEESIRQLVTGNRTLGQRILDWLNRLWERIHKNKAYNEYQLVMHAREAYAKALRETQQNERRAKRQATARETLEDAREGYTAGELSDEEFDAVMDVVAEQESLAEMSQLDTPQFSFGGENARRANLTALDEARQMEKQDVAAETIRQMTGWFRGADGKWRFEIDDSGMRFSARGDLNFGDIDYQRYSELRDRAERDMLGLGGEPLTDAESAEYSELEARYRDYYRQPGVRGDGSLNSTRLSDYVQHDELFEQYPQLRDATLRFAELGGERGSYNRETNTLTLDTSLRGDARSDTLVHEIQHAIQAQEGFARGSNPSYWAGDESGRMYRNTAGEVEARDAAARRQLTAEERRATPPDTGDENTVFIEEDLPVRYSIDEDYERDIDDWDSRGRPDGEVFILGETGDVLQGLGAMEQSVFLRSEKVNAILREHPEMTLDEIRRIPEVLDDPVLIAKSAGSSRSSRNSRLTIMGNLRAQNGRPVMTVLDLRPVEGRLLVDDMQKINSAYTRDNASNYLRRSEILYADEKRTIPLLRSAGLTIASRRLLRDGSMGSITYDGTEVNIEGVPFDEVVSTENTPQYSISDTERRRDVMSQLRRYVGGEIDSAQLQNYLNGRAASINEEHGEAQNIIDRAHAAGMSVQEFVRWNWDEFEADGQPNEAAQRAMELEKFRSARRYSISDPERVYIAPGNITVVQNAAPDEYRRMRNASYIDYPWLMNTGDSPIVRGMDASGNTYHWRADLDYDDNAHVWAGEHFGENIEPQYSIIEDSTVEQQSEVETEYKRILSALPGKARTSLSRAENELLFAISKALGVPYAAQRDSLRAIIHEITVEYMNDGTVSQETIDELFERAYDAGVIIDREYYDQYKPVLDYLRKAQLKISPEDSADIPDFNSFRTHNIGRLPHLSTRDGTTNIDQVFQELNELWPELFDVERYIVPSDQLRRIAQVAQGIRIAEISLDKALGSDAEAFRNSSREEYKAQINKTMEDLRTVRRFAVDQAGRSNEGVNYTPKSEQEAMALWQELKPARKKYERILARNLLTRADEQAVSRLMDGKMSLEDLDSDLNIRGITEVYAAKQAYEDIAAQLKRWNQQRKDRLDEQADVLLRNSDQWKDKSMGALYSRETMERNIRDIVDKPEDAEAIINTYFTPVHEATARGNRMKNEYRDRVRALNLSRKVSDGNIVSEAHAVQLLGEAEDALRMIEQSKGRIKERDGKTREDWRGIIQNLWKENPKLDQTKIRSAVEEFRKIYDELFEQMNEVRVRNGYEPVNYRSGYFPHFQPGEGDGILSQFGRVLGIDTQVTALPTTINGLTHTFRPGITWFGNAQERIGFNTVYDAVEGFDKYIEGVSDVIMQTDNIQRLRALANRVRYNTGDEGTRRRMDQIKNDPTIKEEDKENRLKNLREEGHYTLSNFVVELDEYTNLLANKKSRHDRTSEQNMGRRYYNIIKAAESRVAANMVVLNPTSWLSNLIPITQGWAQLGTGDLVTAMWDTLRSFKEDDGIISRSTFLTNRQGSDPLVKVWEQGPEPEKASSRKLRAVSEKVGNAETKLSDMMQYVDMFTAGSLVRAKYKQNLGKGMSDEAAMADADAFAASVMADRSKGAQPTLFNRRSPFYKMFTQFQLEINNQLSYMFKDIPRNVRGTYKGAVLVALLKFALGAWLFDEFFEALFGRRPALDPFDILIDAAGDLFGFEVPNFVELGWGALSGNLPSEPFAGEQTGVGGALGAIISGVAENLPFMGVIPALGLDESMGLDFDAGRVPLESAIPNVGTISRAITDPDWSLRKRIEEAADELLRPAAYIVPPFGGSVIKRIYDGIRAMIEGGAYDYDEEGNQLLQYPFYKDSAGDALWNFSRGVFMGFTSFGPGEEWVEEGFPTLTAEQTATYQGLLEAGVDGRAAYDLIKDFRAAESADEKRYLITQSDISGDGKSVAYYGLMASDSERKLMDELAESGADMGEVTDAIIGIRNAQRLDGAQETEYKLGALLNAELDVNDKYALYRALISDTQDEDILAFSDAGLSFDQYLQAKRQYAIIDEDAADSTERALQFAEWVDGLDIADEQAAVMRDTLAPLRGDIGKLAEAGMDYESAADVADALDNLGEDASSTEEYMAIAQMPISEQEKEIALEAIMSDSAFEKYERAVQAGIDTYDYCSFLDEISTYSGDGKQERIWAYINSMPLTSAQKDTLHLAAGYKESTLSKTPWH